MYKPNNHLTRQPVNLLGFPVQSNRTHNANGVSATGYH